MIYMIKRGIYIGSVYGTFGLTGNYNYTSGLFNPDDSYLLPISVTDDFVYFQGEPNEANKFFTKKKTSV